MTLEDKEIEFRGFVSGKLEEIHIDDIVDYNKEAHNLIQDFKEEIEGFNKAMLEENEKLKEKLEAFGDAFTEFTNKVNNYE